MKAVYWIGLALGVALVLFGYFGDNVRWLIYVGVAVVFIGGAFNPKRPFYGLRK
jgi:hypothetical protein